MEKRKAFQKNLKSLGNLEIEKGKRKAFQKNLKSLEILEIENGKA